MAAYLTLFDDQGKERRAGTPRVSLRYDGRVETDPDRALALIDEIRATLSPGSLNNADMATFRTSVELAIQQGRFGRLEVV